MPKIIGIIAIALGVMLLFWGHDSAQSFNSQFRNIFTGNPTDKTLYFYAGGVALTIYGLFLTFWRWR
jgi:hypothetical protein